MFLFLITHCAYVFRAVIVSCVCSFVYIYIYTIIDTMLSSPRTYQNWSVAP